MSKNSKSQTEMLEDVADVAKRMIETPTLGTADPRYWVIRQKVWHAGIPGDGELHVFSCSDVHGMSCHEFLDELLRQACEEAECNAYDLPVNPGENGLPDTMELAGTTFKRLPQGDETDPDSWTTTDVDEYDVADAIDEDDLPEFAIGQFRAVWGDWEYEDVPNTMFLTLEEAKRHIELNHYHYHEPTTYGRLAWRAPDVERLWQALKGIDWNALIELSREDAPTKTADLTDVVA